MMRILTRACLVALVVTIGLAVAPIDAWAGGRLALVIGNGKYDAAPLATPSNDAADVAQHLRAIGFDVVEQRDATREGMARAIHDFSGRLRNADVALFFFAGHAVQLNGSNFLLPTDAKIENSADVRFDTIELNDIAKEMEGGGRTSILLLDACRPNPFVDKLSAAGGTAVAPGLGRIDAAAPQSLIVYAAQPNSVAQEGTSRNSPFTAALLAHLDTRGLDVRQMVSKVRTDVLRATGHRQTPWDLSSLTGDVDLAGPATDTSAVPSSAPATAPAAPSSPPAIAANQGHPADQPTPAPSTPAPSAPPPPTDSANSTPAPNPGPAPNAGPTNDCDRLAALRVPVFSANGAPPPEHIDWAKAVDACEAMVKAHPGEMRFEYQLGRAYDNLKDYIPAVSHYQVAADANFAEAQNDLGVAYYRGEGVLRNYDAAFSLVNEAAQQGSARALANLSALYADGKGVRKDDAKSLELAEKAVESGNPFALVVIGNHYFNGAGVAKDYKEAAQYFQQAADLGNGYAMKILANMYANGYLGAADLAKAGELRYRAQQVDPTSNEPAPLPTYRAASARVYRPRVHRRYVIYRRFFGFGGCVYVCF